MGRPVSPTTTKGKHYRVVPRQARGRHLRLQRATSTTRPPRSARTWARSTRPRRGSPPASSALGVLSDGPGDHASPPSTRRWLESQARRATTSARPSRYAEDAHARVRGHLRHRAGERHHQGGGRGLGAGAPLALRRAPGDVQLRRRPPRRAAGVAVQGQAPERARKGSRRALTEPELLTLAELARERHGAWHEVLLLWKGYGGQRLAELLDTRVRLPGGPHRQRQPARAGGDPVAARGAPLAATPRGSRERAPHYIIIPGWVADAAAPLIEAARSARRTA